MQRQALSDCVRSACPGGVLGGSVPDHLLVNYRKSLVAICLAQFNSAKGFEGGGQVLVSPVSHALVMSSRTSQAHVGRNEKQ